MTEHPELSLAELLVLATINEINDRKMLASNATILAILELTPVVTGIDLNCPDVLNPETIDSACRCLESIGYISDKDRTPAPAVEGERTATWTAHTLSSEEYEMCRRAVEFSAEVTSKLSPEQYEAVFTLVLCRTVGRWEGWYDDDADVLAMVREKLPESLAEAERGLLIAETMKEIWARQQSG